MNTESTPISELDEKRILVEVELQRMSERRARAKQRAESQIVFGLYLAAIIFYVGLIYWSKQYEDSRAFIVIMVSCPIASAFIGMFAKMYRDIGYIRGQLEKNINETKN